MLPSPHVERQALEENVAAALLDLGDQDFRDLDRG